ncbi:EF-hand superfamily Ca2+-modulated protein [Lepidopterella palustris CBS 459.81]|uniref:Calmodulin n=1 Tax=Lepidopterella palustris CBS 459.81 TaxID=1314670 RepID=A0A8E2EAY7_9PEZI|nr:EF-hand superfamily Ca2+-modulated protein [Lepidopterella palustris CBS 459.81]
MPPRRHAALSSNPTIATKRPSKLAKENNITAEQEAEIREAFGLFAVRHPDYQDAKEGVLRAEDVRRCLKSLNLAPSPSSLPEILSTIDPLNSGFIPLAPFLSYAAIAVHSKADSNSEPSSDEAPHNAAEVRAAYKLFTHGDSGPITLAHLRRVAKELREDVSDDVLRDMIVEANAGMKGKRRGDVGTVGLEEFESVMKRAGVFG